MDFAQGPQIGAAIPHKSAISSLSFHGDGVHLFAASEADSKVYLINTQTGTCDQPAFRCEREGVSLVSSTHHDQCVLIGGGKGSANHNAIHYWSLYDNKILRKFRGHSDTITDMSLCPSEDMFLTASRDRTVRLWNVQQAGCIAQLTLPSNTVGQPHCVFDSTGMVFAVMAEMTAGQGNVRKNLIHGCGFMELSPSSFWFYAHAFLLLFIFLLFLVVRSFVRCSKLFRRGFLRDASEFQRFE